MKSLHELFTTAGRPWVKANRFAFSICIHSNEIQNDDDDDGDHDEDDDDDDDDDDMMMMEHKTMIKTQSDDFEAKHDDHSVYVIHLHSTLNYFARTFLGTIIYKDTLEVVIPVYQY